MKDDRERIKGFTRKRYFFLNIFIKEKFKMKIKD
jgi:hypothetical protein